MITRTLDVSLRASDDTERTAEFIISTGARDSHRTVLNQDGWDLSRYSRNGVVGYQHNVWGGGMCNEPNPDFILGPGRAWTEGIEPRDAPRSGGQTKQLVGQWTAEPREINELADKIWRKVQFGTLKATSVGFAEKGEGRYGEGDEARGGPNETYYFAGQELFEWSIVNMGSNPETVKRQLEADTKAAVAFINQRTGIGFKDILRMTVGDVLKAIDEGPLWSTLESTSRGERRQLMIEFVKDSIVN